MNDIVSNIGTYLRTIRKLRNLSLDETAALTGVSKAMLGQIERGESSPTVSTMWKISSGLKITFSALMGDASDSYKAVALGELQSVYELDEKMIVHVIFPFDPIRGFEYQYVEMKPGCNHISPTHDNVLEEYIVVGQGVFVLTINDQTFTLREGSSIKFRGSENHTYINHSNETVILHMVLRYA